MDADRIASFALHGIHLWAWALYAGGFTYIYARLFPDLRRSLRSDEDFERYSLIVAEGLRWRILGTIGVAAASGIGLVLLRQRTDASVFWWTAIAIKCALFVATITIYVYVSWVMWPRRVFIDAAARPAEWRRFHTVALLLAALLLCQLLLGAAIYLAV